MAEARKWVRVTREGMPDEVFLKGACQVFMLLPLNVKCTSTVGVVVGRD
jgi:hypothetical protein